jgi:hypothetical protein
MPECLAWRLAAAAALAAGLTGCGTGISAVPPGPIELSLSSTAATVAQDGTPATVNVTIARPSGDSGAATLNVQGLPNNVSASVTNPGSGSAGSITFTASGGAAGSYQVAINASDSVSSGSAPLNLTVAIVATVGTTQSSPFNTFMATSFQPAEWDYSFFSNQPSGVATLANLGSQHTRLQPLSAGTPQKADQSWDFSTLDAILDPVISVGDKSPELQLAVAPAWMDDSSGHLEPAHFQDFANYAADVVKYYNTTAGFTDGSGIVHVHSPYTPITWWGIFNEPNINGLTAAQYTELYNLVVPAMQAAGSNIPIKFAAVELADFGTQSQLYMPTFAAGVTAQVDVVATHFYSSCNQADSDQQVLGTVPFFASEVTYIYSQLATNAALAAVPVWVTENNVNADFDKGGGISACNGTAFVLDRRGTSAFFAAWRPYVFSQLAHAGAQSLYHWDFDADAQFGEVDYNTDATYLSYWVDQWLASTFPSPPGGAIMAVASTESSPASVEVMAVKRSDGSLAILVSDHAVVSSTDNNGPGSPRTVMLDLSRWSAFSTATLTTFDATTDPTHAPTPVAVAPAGRMAVNLNGYGTAFLVLK